MTQDYKHPITPPPELVQQWYDQAKKDPCGPINWVAVKAAQWGADTELEACCKWLAVAWKSYAAIELRAARRPKPLSLKEQALEVLEDAKLDAAHYNILLRALEQLDG
jgi:hypothetical protein